MNKKYFFLNVDTEDCTSLMVILHVIEIFFSIKQSNWIFYDVMRLISDVDFVTSPCLIISGLIYVQCVIAGINTPMLLNCKEKQS